MKRPKPPVTKALCPIMNITLSIATNVEKAKAIQDILTFRLVAHTYWYKLKKRVWEWRLKRWERKVKIS